MSAKTEDVEAHRTWFEAEMTQALANRAIPVPPPAPVGAMMGDRALLSGKAS